MPSPTSADLLELATAIARESGDLLASYAERTSLGVDTKTTTTDPVSEADHASERLITERILGALPDDGILGEEDAADRPGTSGRRWVIDPLDGTVNFLYGIPQWCVSIACEDEDGDLVGVVHDPSRDETFATVRGEPARCGDRELSVRRPADLGHTLVSTGFAYDAALRAEQGRRAADLLTRVRDIRRGGAAALDLAWVAAGRVDGYYEFGLAPWDWAAGRQLVRNAGGVVSTVHATLAGAEREGLVAGATATHDALRDWLGAP